MLLVIEVEVAEGLMHVCIHVIVTKNLTQHDYMLLFLVSDFRFAVDNIH